MLFQKVKLVFLPVFVVLFLFSCEKGSENVYTGDENAINDSVDNGDETNEYQERPDGDHIPNGNVGDKDIDHVQSDTNNDPNDEDMSDPDSEVNDDETGSIYSSEPDLAKCSAGTVSDSEKDIVLARVN